VVGALAIGVGLSAICAAAARSGIDDLDLFPVFADNEMTDEDSAIVAGVGALKACVMRLYGVVLILGGWVRRCARLLCGHEVAPSWSVPRGVSPPPGLPTLSTT
jgi:hypothetical protein